jgi:hypothetical protein
MYRYGLCILRTKDNQDGRNYKEQSSFTEFIETSRCGNNGDDSVEILVCTDRLLQETGRGDRKLKAVRTQQTHEDSTRAGDTK